MKIYVAFIDDRHAETDAEVFVHESEAIAYASKTANEYCKDGDIDDSTCPDGWLYYAVYSDEGDSVWVMEKELHDDSPTIKPIEPPARDLGYRYDLYDE